MRKEDGNSAQCAWLFGHAHLTGETSIEFKYGIQIYFSALSLVLDASIVAAFLALLAPFLTLTAFAAVSVLAVFLIVFFAALFALATDLRCCFARSARN